MVQQLVQVLEEVAIAFQVSFFLLLKERLVVAKLEEEPELVRLLVRQLPIMLLIEPLRLLPIRLLACLFSQILIKLKVEVVAKLAIKLVIEGVQQAITFIEIIEEEQVCCLIFVKVIGVFL